MLEVKAPADSAATANTAILNHPAVALIRELVAKLDPMGLHSQLSASVVDGEWCLALHVAGSERIAIGARHQPPSQTTTLVYSLGVAAPRPGEAL